MGGRVGFEKIPEELAGVEFEDVLKRDTGDNEEFFFVKTGATEGGENVEARDDNTKKLGVGW